MTAPPSDPRVRGFAEALASAIARQLAREIREAQATASAAEKERQRPAA